eukprot:3850110-Pleurochrysis_carterae.AAC.1
MSFPKLDHDSAANSYVFEDCQPLLEAGRTITVRDSGLLCFDECCERAAARECTTIRQAPSDRRLLTAT